MAGYCRNHPHHKVIPAYFVLGGCKPLMAVGYSSAQAIQETCPWPRTYVEMTALTSGWVTFSDIQEVMQAMDCSKATVRPASGHTATCRQVSSLARQLGQLQSRPSWCDRNFIMPAIPNTCFDAHNRNNRGTECKAECTSGQPTSSKPYSDIIFFHRNSAFASCWCAWNPCCGPGSEINFLPSIRIPMGSKGKSKSPLCFDWPGLPTRCFARWCRCS